MNKRKIIKDSLISVLIFSIIWIWFAAVTSWDPLTATLWNDLTNKVSTITSDGININISWKVTRAITHTWSFWQTETIGNDSTIAVNNVKLTSRTLSFTKEKDSSSLRIWYSDIFRIKWWVDASNSCVWEVKVDWISCPSKLQYAKFGRSPTYTDFHTPASVFWYCDNISAWAHTIDVYITNDENVDLWVCYTWWNGSWALEVEEIN